MPDRRWAGWRHPTARILVAVALLGAACAGGGGSGGGAPTAEPVPPPAPTTPEPADSASPGTTAPTETPSAAPTTATAPAPAVSLAEVAGTLALVEVATLEQPTATTVRAGEPDAVYVAERTGQVRVLRGDAVTDEVVLDLSDQTVAEGERGLLGIAFSPDGRTLYASYTNLDGNTRLDAYAMDGAVADPASRQELLAVEQPFSNHNGGHVIAGADGTLWFGLGDGGSAGDPMGNGQDTSTLLGSLLRLAPDGSAAPGNPGFEAPEIWAYGLRNPWRFSFDRATGDLWIGDVGQRAIEEIDYLPAPELGRGANLGWNLVEGTEPFAGEAPPDAVPPIAQYDHSQGRCSITGGVVYRGEALQDLRGAYLYGDFCGGAVVALRQDGGAVTDQAALDLRVEQLVHIGEDTAGELFLLSLAGPVYRLTPAD